MREIVVISGKGGAGKTSFCACLAHLAHRAVLCDLDVDAPDLHIILDPKPAPKELFISGNEAVIRTDDCLRCGKCAKLCQFDAVRTTASAIAAASSFGAISSPAPAGFSSAASPTAPSPSISSAAAPASLRAAPVIDPLRCEGCGVCVQLCLAQVIDFPEKTCGEWQISESRFGSFVHACLYPGQENSGRLITLLKQKARDVAKAQGLDFIIYDGSPGIGCPVISSLSGAHLAVAVVEPTPSGRHDFERVAALCDHFRIPVAVVINKADLNTEEAEQLAQWSRDKGYFVAGRIPFSSDITQAMLERKALTETSSSLAPAIREIAERIFALPSSPSHATISKL